MSAVVFEETVRRHITSAGFIVYTLLLALVGIFVATFHMPASMWPSLVTLLAIITGSAIIGPEFSTGTLQLIVSKPVARSAYLLGRVAGVFASVGLAASVAVAAEVMTRVILGSETPWRRLFDVFAGELVVVLLAIALLTLLGSITVAYFNVAIYVGIQMGFSVAQALLGALQLRNAFIQEHPEIAQILATIDDTLFPSAPQVLTSAWVVKSVALAAVALALACLSFRRREVPYGAE
jgi:ABC-type transport system involved in multi-copper enzyme maturation permease subunit